MAMAFRGLNFEQIRCVNDKVTPIIKTKCQLEGLKVGSGCKQGPHYKWYSDCRNLAFETARQQCGLPANLSVGTFTPPTLGKTKDKKKKKLVLVAIDEDDFSDDEYLF